MLENRYDDICKEKNHKERECVEKLENLERAHNNAIETVETLYEKKISIEDERYRRLEREKFFGEAEL